MILWLTPNGRYILYPLCLLCFLILSTITVAYTPTCEMHAPILWDTMRLHRLKAPNYYQIEEKNDVWLLKSIPWNATLHRWDTQNARLIATHSLQDISFEIRTKVARQWAQEVVGDLIGYRPEFEQTNPRQIMLDCSQEHHDFISQPLHLSPSTNIKAPATLEFKLNKGLCYAKHHYRLQRSFDLHIRQKNSGLKLHLQRSCTDPTIKVQGQSDHHSYQLLLPKRELEFMYRATLGLGEDHLQFAGVTKDGRTFALSRIHENAHGHDLLTVIMETYVIRHGQVHRIPLQQLLTSSFHAPQAKLSDDGTTLVILSDQSIKTYIFNTELNEYQLAYRYTNIEHPHLDFVEGTLDITKNTEHAQFFMNIDSEHQGQPDRYRRAFQVALTH